MEAEINALAENKTWSLESLFPRKKCICNFHMVFNLQFQVVNRAPLLWNNITELDELVVLPVHCFQIQRVPLFTGSIGACLLVDRISHMSFIFCLYICMLMLLYEQFIFLKGTPTYGITLWSVPNLTLSGWCDSEWVVFPLTRSSLTKWLPFLGPFLVPWKTKKQPTVSLSSAEAEYRSLAALTCELK